MIILIAITAAIMKVNNLVNHYLALHGHRHSHYHTMGTLETLLWINVFVAIFILITRILSAIFSLIASKEPHSSKNETIPRVEVPMQAVTVASPDQIYVKPQGRNTLIPINGGSVVKL